MARRKKSDGGTPIVTIAAALLVLFALVPTKVWFSLVAAAALWLVIRIFDRDGPPSTEDEESPAEPQSLMAKAASAAPTRYGVPTQRSPGQQRQASATGAAVAAKPSALPENLVSNFDNPVQVAPRPSAATIKDFKVPNSPKYFGPAVWIAHGTSVEVAGVSIPGGLVYIGTSLKTPSGGNDPCLIDPSKPVAAQGDYTDRQMGYWPSYSELSGTGRRAYLNWLAGGRSDPNADIGYVFVFFYGLERRAIIDAHEDPAAMSDWPAIAHEIRRLLDIYGDRSASFRTYAGELLNWVSLSTASQLYAQPMPELPKTFDVPLYVRLALGQAALDAVPVPAPLALAWITMDPAYSLRTPAIRCADQFKAQFQVRYHAAFGSGMVIPKNRTKLKFVYRPASAGFRGLNEIKLTFGDTPDVSVLTKPIKALRAIADTITDELDAYSRYIGRNPDANGSLEGLLFLPLPSWPSSARQAIDDLKARVIAGPVQMGYQELLSRLGAKAALNKERSQALARMLSTICVGVEPDILGGTKLPKPEEPIVLFGLPAAEDPPRSAPAYQAALLTVQLASAVAAADGAFCGTEIDHLRAQVQAWVHLAPSHQIRLLAHLQLLTAAPASLPSLKKRLEALNAPARESIASFMTILAQADGKVSPEEVKVLEKVYKVLGIDAKKVFSDLHAASSSASPPTVTTTGFKLDPARIAALQQDTAKVSALLAGIFIEDIPEQPATPVEVMTDAPLDPVDESTPAPLLGLDETHAALARMLLTRPQWTREEMQDLAVDLDLMLDGALERINEAAFDAYDIPFTEGEDPIDVNHEVREKIEA